MNSESEYIEFKCIEIEQPIGSFYIGKIRYDDLIDITYADVRRIEARDIEKVLGIQRPLSPKRVRELEKYVNLIDSTFPTSIILAIPTRPQEDNENDGQISDDERLVQFDEKSMVMKVRKLPNIAKIIDGQHRIAGLKEFKDGNFELNVTIFVDMDLENQAMVFSTINLTQTKVNRSLALDLLDYATKRSPKKTCHDIARLLNSKVGSPFKDKIKILGRATEEGRETITQAAFVDSLLKYISRDSMGDSDIIKRGKKPEKADEVESRQLIFRNMFIEEEDAKIARITWNYFSAVSERWNGAWNEVERGRILNRTNGFFALMRFFQDCYLTLDNGRFNIVSTAQFSEIFNKIQLVESDFNPERYLPGSSGVKDLYNDLLEMSNIRAIK